MLLQVAVFYPFYVANIPLHVCVYIYITSSPSNRLLMGT